MIKLQTDVVIVGAGPVGLLLACELQKRGVDHAVVEARPRRDGFCKALGVTPRTLEIFDLMGILDDALDRGLWPAGMNTTADGEIVARERAQVDGLPYGFFILAQPETENILEDFLRAHGGSVTYGTVLKDVTQNADSVTAHLLDGRDVRCKWLVACDGAHSAVRKALQIPFEGHGYPMVFLLGDVELGWDRPHAEGWKMIVREDGEMRNMIVAVPVPGNPRRYRLSMAAPPAYAADGAVLPEHPDLDLLRSVASTGLPPGTPVDNLRWSSMYRISHRIVPHYAYGRVFLAGDAAHIHPPIGGQGMNTGLQDAFNLGWKLAHVCRGAASRGLLDTYDEERRPVGQAVVELTARRMDAAVADDRSDLESDHANDESQLYISYRDRALAVDNRKTVSPLLAGDRVPFVGGLRRPRIERTARLVDVLRGGHFQLLVHGTDNVDAVLSLTRCARQTLGGDVRCAFVAAPDQAIDLREEIPIWIDGDGGFERAFGPHAAVWLVRPDGHLGWAGELDVAAFGTYLARLSGATAHNLSG